MTQSKRPLAPILHCVFLVTLLVGAPIAPAMDPPKEKPHNCADHMINGGDLEIHMHGSGRDPDIQPPAKEAAHHIYGIARDIGLDVPPMQIRHADANDMVALTSGMGGGHPAPHWFDGHSIVNGARKASGILEVVFPGSYHHHQYVRDTNTFHETAVVYAHVAGHYDFFLNFPALASRDADPILSSYQLSRRMSELFTTAGHREVTEFYQQMLTLVGLQDYTSASYEDPESFKSDNPDRAATRRGTREPRPTRSVLQAMVHNLSPDAPGFKRELIGLFEKSVRKHPASVRSRTMNEGWATFVTYMILVQSKYNSSHDRMNYAQLQAGVRYPRLDNVYWLGSEGWFRFWERFNERPGMKEMDPKERDRLFIKEAHDLMSRVSGDLEFLRYTLDDKWVDKQELFLYRELPGNPNPWWFQPPLPQGKRRQAISRDPERVIRWLTNRLNNLRLKFAEIELADFNHANSGTVLLRHTPHYALPLKRSSIAKALYVIAQFFERPVKIDTIGSWYWTAPLSPNVPVWVDDENDPWGGTWGRVTLPAKTTYPMSVTVTPDGKVSLEVAKEDEHRLPPGLADRLQRSVDGYRASMQLNGPADVPETHKNWWEEVKSRMAMELLGGDASAVSGNVVTIGNHAPTAPQAVLEYLHTVKYRLARILSLAAQGKWGVKFSPGGTKVRVPGALPEIPSLDLDHSILKKREKFMTPTQPEPRVDPSRPPSILAAFGLDEAPAQRAAPTEGLPDEDLDITVGPQLPGDIWDVKPNGDGKGKGQGEGEGDEEDEEEDGEGEEEGDGAGNGSGGGSYEEIPLSVYGEILSQWLQLPNLRPTRGGDIENPDTIREDSEHNRVGTILWEKTAAEALGLGMALAKKQGLDAKKLGQRKLLEMGLLALPPNQYVVSSREEDPEPRDNAVVVWMTDTSGSMGAEHRKAMRQMIYNERAILKSQYPRLKEVFVIYDTEARVVDEDEFFGTQLGGGTNAAPAARLVMDELKKYPESEYNRFGRWFSDGDDGGSDTLAEAKRLARMLDFLGYNHVDPWGNRGPWGLGPLSEGFRELATQDPQKIGYAELDGSFPSIVATLKAFYGPRPRAEAAGRMN